MSLRGLVRPLLCLLLCVAAPPAQAQLPPLVSEEQEAQQGAAAHPQIVKQYGGIYDDPELGAYVAMIGARLLAAAGQSGKEYTLSILDSDIPNAFALPGGFAYVTRGLLAIINTEAELAGVMGHEIGHVIARHSAQRQSGALFAGLLAGAIGAISGSADAAQIAGMLGQGALARYSQSQEYEADELGVRYMRAAGWNPLAQADMLSALKRESDLMAARFGQQGSPLDDFFATHPNTLERVGRAVGLARQGGAGGEYGREAWLRHIDGLVYGGSPNTGYVRGRTFLHPLLRIQFTAPADWPLQNGATQVIAKGRDGTLVFDEARDAGGRADPYHYATTRWLKDIRFSSLQRVTIDGLNAAIGTALIPQQGGSTLPLHVAVIEHDRNRYYRFQAVAERGADHDKLVESFLSFRRLRPQEAQAIRPWRIRIFQFGAQDSVASLSQLMAMPEDKESIFRVINALDPGMTLRPGDRVKIVVEDR